MGLIVLLLLAAGSAFPLWLPPLAQPYARDWLQQQLSSTEATLQLKQVGYGRCTLAHVTLPLPGTDKAITLDRLAFHYRPWQLLQGHVRHIQINGVHIPLAVASHQPQTATSTDRSNPAWPPRMPDLPDSIWPQQVTVENITFGSGQKPLARASIKLLPSPSGDQALASGQYQLQARCYASDQQLRLSGLLNIPQMQGNLQLEAQGNLAQLWPRQYAALPVDKAQKLQQWRLQGRIQLTPQKIAWRQVRGALGPTSGPSVICQGQGEVQAGNQGWQGQGQWRLRTAKWNPWLQESLQAKAHWQLQSEDGAWTCHSDVAFAACRGALPSGETWQLSSLQGTLNVTSGQEALAWQGKLCGQQPQMRSAAWRGHAEQLCLRFQGQRQLSEAVLQLQGGVWTYPQLPLKAGGITLICPWQRHKTRQGSLTIGTLRLEDKILGSLQGQLETRPQGLRLHLAGADLLWPQLRMRSHLDLEKSRQKGWRWHGQATLELPPGASLALGQWDEAWQGWRLQGQARAQARFHGDGSGLKIPLEVTLADARVQGPEFAWQDLDLNWHWPDVAESTYSEPAAVSWHSLRWRHFHTAPGMVSWQMLPEGQLLLEKAYVGWAQGVVHAHGLRYPPPQGQMAGSLYCDRLELAQFLQQLQVADISGQGQVSGRLPWRLKEERLHLDGGFLYSTPGEEGHLSVAPGRWRAQLAGGGTMLGLTLAALESFTYDWARLQLQQAQQELTLQLSLSGRPDKPLPFRYDPQQGSWRATESRQKGSILEGINLNLRLHMPIHKLWRMSRPWRQ